MGHFMPPTSVDSQLPAVKAVRLRDAPAARPPGRTSSPHKRSGDIRTWAKGQSIPVSERGRIPASIAEQYEAAAS
jgi:hypothetical protein